MIRAYYKDNPQAYKDFEDFLFLFPARHNITFDFGSDTIFIDNEKFTLSRVQFIADNSEDFERFELKENKNQPEGYAGLNAEAKIPPELLPSGLLESNKISYYGDKALWFKPLSTTVWGLGGIQGKFTSSIKSPNDAEITGVLFDFSLSPQYWAEMTVRLLVNGDEIISGQGSDYVRAGYGVFVLVLGRRVEIKEGDVLTLELESDRSYGVSSAHYSTGYGAYGQHGSVRRENYSNILGFQVEGESKIVIESGIIKSEDSFGSYSLNKELGYLRRVYRGLELGLDELNDGLESLESTIYPLSKTYLQEVSIDGSERAFLRIVKTTGAFAIKFLLIENNTDYPTKPVEILLSHLSHSNLNQGWQGDLPGGLSGINEIGVYDGGDGYWYVMPVAPPLYVDSVLVQVLYSTTGFEYVEREYSDTWTHLYSLVST